MEAGTFALVPIEVIKDKRLTLEHTRVLIALFSFRNKNTNTVWPSRAAIAERTGMHVSNISSATTDLVNLGWLTKDGVGGYSKSTRYTITVPDALPEKKRKTVADSTTVAQSATVAEQTTVADSTTVAEQATQTLAESATRVVADSATRKEHTKEHTKEQTSCGAVAVVADGAQLTPPEPVAAATRRTKTQLTPDMQEACRSTWDGYCGGYAARYGVQPVFNAKVAGQVVNFVKRVGMKDAPEIARWFPGHAAAFYVGRGHTVDTLLRDAEKLRTEWMTGRVMTSTKAKQSDRSGATMSALQEVLAERGEATGGAQ